MYTTTAAIEDLIRATLGDSPTAAERHFMRQSLLSLVRLAQAEQREEMQASVGKVLEGTLQAA